MKFLNFFVFLWAIFAFSIVYHIHFCVFKHCLKGTVSSNGFKPACWCTADLGWLNIGQFQESWYKTNKAPLWTNWTNRALAYIYFIKSPVQLVRHSLWNASSTYVFFKEPLEANVKLIVNMARSDESEPEDRDTVERDALLLAQTYTSQETKVGAGCTILEACLLKRGSLSSLFGSVVNSGCFFHPGSWVRIKEFHYFNPKNC